ncbi:MAG: NAD(P)H-dependent oxidoreductase [Sphingomonas sp.]|uniref:NADPH-dependent FMN reductase n=1 Tax=Sphingomonas sp. TaxID=28214 RepID=UPI0017BB0293|nr:NADPH-dependent FMN reductase [Sphingomonas sp.]MBA3668109.1 NAD(P)H-dependent oxidoreductase [Sphingomonas sp.]
MTLTLLGLAGSLRRGSINQQLLTAMAMRAPTEIGFQLFDGLGAIPVFNEDLETPTVPAGVQSLSRAVQAADVLVISTPEYNQSLPGVVKNAIDWLSRSPDQPLGGKPCVVTGATVGKWGTRIAQQQLRTVLTTCGARVLTGPALYVADGAMPTEKQSELDVFLNAIVTDFRKMRPLA